MTSLSTSTPIKSKSPKNSKSSHLVRRREITVIAAQRLVDAVTFFTEHDPKKGQDENRMLPFAQAYASLESAIPRRRRLEFFRAMEKALASKIKKTELAESLSASTKSEKTQQENDAFMADLRNQEQMLRTQDIAAKKLLSSEEMRKCLGFTPQALSAAVRAKRMFALTGPSGGSLYPAFFADPKYDRRNLEKVSKVLAGLSGGSKWDFFTTPKISLGNKTPLDALAKGKLDLVLVAAAGFLES